MKRYVIALLATGCGSSGLEVSFTIDDADLAAAVQRYSVEVYRPETNGYDCADLAFGAVQAMPTFEAQLERSIPDLGRIAVEGTKLVVVRGHGDAGEVVVGCAAIERIEGDATLDIRAEPVTRLEIEGATDGLTGGERGPRRDTFDRWAVTVVDRLGRARTNIDVRWRAFGSGMTEAVRGDAQQDANGAFVVLPSEPRPGPLRVVVRSRWGVEESAASVMVPPEVTSTVLDGPGVDLQIVRSASARPRVLTTARLSESETNVVQYDLEDGAIRKRSEIVPGRWRLGRTSASRFLLSDVAVRHLTESPAGDLTIGPELPFQSNGGVFPTGMIDLSACDRSDARVQVWFGEQTEIYDGALVSTGEPGNRFAAASGCIEIRGGGAQRATWTPPLTGFELHVRGAGGLSLVSIDDAIVGLAFGGQWGGRPVALTTSVIGRETTIAIATLTSNDSEIALVRERAESFVGPAHALDVGDIDANGVLDIAAITRIDDAQFALYLVAGGDGESAAAGTLLPVSFVDPWLAVVDFDDDGVDDIAVGDRRVTAEGEARPLVFYTMGR